jgi:hypothetical protein
MYMFSFRLQKRNVLVAKKPIAKKPIVKLNYRKQKLDARDYKPLLLKTAVPTTYIIPEFHPSLVLDQGDFGSCVSCAMNVGIRLLNKDINASILHTYYYGRLMSKCSNLEDTGLEIRDACKVMQKIGYCNANDWTYDQAKFYELPVIDGSLIKPLPINNFKYFSVNQNVNDLKLALSEGKSIICGIYVYPSFLNATKGGQVPMPQLENTYKIVRRRKVLDKQAERCLGGHCILIVGYNEQNFICVNSWGTKWGDEGKFYLPHAYVSNPNLAIDFTYVTM